MKILHELILVIALGMLLTLATGLATAEEEPNDDYANSEEVAPGTITGTMNETDVLDYYKFQAGEGDMISLTFSADATGTEHHLFFMDPGKHEIFELRSAESAVDIGTYWTCNETGTDYWYLILDNEDVAGHNPGAYTIELVITRQDDAGTGTDIPASWSGAYTIEPDVTVAGHLEDLDDYDYYSFEGGNGDVFKITFTSKAQYEPHNLYLKDYDKDEVIELQSIDESDEEDTFYTTNETEVGTWYIVIDGTSTGGTVPADYEFTLEVWKQDDADSGNDVMADFTGSYELIAGMYDGQMVDLDRIDVYKVEVGPGWSLFVNVTNPNEYDLDLIVLDETKSEIETLTSGNDVTSEGSYIIPSSVSEGSYYYLKLEWEYGSDTLCEYALEVGVIAQVVDTEAPDITHTAPGDWTEGEAETIDATITDNVDVTEAKLYYRVTGETEYTEVVMTLGADDVWSADVPDTAVTQTGVEYYIWATDDANEATHPAGGATAPVSVTDVDPPPDTEAPVITHTAPGKGKEDKDLKVEVTVTDNVGVAGVTISYRMGGIDTYTNLTMTADGDKYTINIPKDALTKGDLEYYIIARDTSDNEATEGSDTIPKKVKIEEKDDGPGFAGSAALLGLLAAVVILAVRRRD